jgi:NAD(P)-dependent dehydrogenase (short-subunit alcohol dehydrogenase family)
VNLQDKVIVVTGAAQGIGRAMALRFAQEKPRALYVADLQKPSLEVGIPVQCDVSRESELQALVREAGAVDLFCSNAGIAVAGGPEAPDADWQRIWDINLMSHVWAARAVLPGMLDRGSGYLLQTASAAGLLTMLGSAPYSVTKHAAVAFAEWLSITYGARGIRVSCLCPLFVNTAMLHGALVDAGGEKLVKASPVIEPAQVAEAVVQGIAEERFLILPHPEVARFEQARAGDREKWLASMRKLQEMK